MADCRCRRCENLLVFDQIEALDAPQNGNIEWSQ